MQSTAAMQASVYGTAFPARQAIEKQLVGRCAPPFCFAAGALPLHRADTHPVLASLAVAPRRVQRLPGTGLPSARLGLEVLSGAPPPLFTPLHPLRLLTPHATLLLGDIYDFGFESYLGFPGEKQAAPVGTVHTQMEARLGLGAQPTRPGI